MSVDTACTRPPPTLRSRGLQTAAETTVAAGGDRQGRS